MEPNISDEACAVSTRPQAESYVRLILNIAMAENANANGVEFHFDTEVTDLRPVEDGWEIRTSKGARIRRGMS